MTRNNDDVGGEDDLEGVLNVPKSKKVVNAVEVGIDTTSTGNRLSIRICAWRSPPGTESNPVNVREDTENDESGFVNVECVLMVLKDEKGNVVSTFSPTVREIMSSPNFQPTTASCQISLSLVKLHCCCCHDQGRSCHLESITCMHKPDNLLS